MRKVAIAASLTFVLAAVPISAGADRHGAGGGQRPPAFAPGDPGVGDEYFPFDGNGGYDVDHYDLAITYDPATGLLGGVATITARATQDLSRFNLDLQGLTVRSIEVGHRTASFDRVDAELTVTPARGIRRGSRFITVVRYDGVPEPVLDAFGQSGFIATDDGALVVGQPDVAATWFPVNDHPIDAASYSFDVSVPAGTEVIANGRFAGRRTRNGWTTWSWEARAPMASYLATATMGQFLVDTYRADGITFVDAIDPDLFEPRTPHTGARAAVSQAADGAYKRLTRTISVPATGATMTFWVSRSTEADWDYFFVEARHAGGDDWTTLPEANGITADGTGQSCPYWLDIHPFLTHYQTDNGDDTCAPVGTPPDSGAWHAVTGDAPEWQQWEVDLGAYAGSDVEVSLAYASDDEYQALGVAIDDVEVSTGEGSTSFEDDGDPLDGWVVSGAPAGSPGNANDWIVAGEELLPASVGDIASGSFARQPEILRFLAGYFGPYPFDDAGGIVDDAPELGFALENQTRPIYSPLFFTDQLSGDIVVVHELAHQWFGDDVRLARWKDIWLNEGFATYAEWLWAEHEGLGTAHEQFEGFMGFLAADDPFWSVPIGDPGPDRLFDEAVYVRGALTLHALRLTVGDDAFFRIVRTWARRESGEAVTTPEFVRLAESISHQDLDALFATWLDTPAKPDAPSVTGTARAASTTSTLPPVLRAQLARWGIGQR
ncbi:MAG: M1 family metallopeptidase [Ilumatobacteraceae bacterium]